MKILHITGCFDLSGRAKMIGDLCLNMQSKGHDCRVVSLAEPSYDVPGVLCEHIGKSEGLDRRTLLSVIKYIRKWRPDVINSHGRKGLFYTSLASRFTGGVKLIHSVHRADGDLLSRRPAVRRFILSRVSSFTAVTEAAKRSFCDLNGVSADLVCVINNGIELSKYEAGSMDDGDSTDSSGLTVGSVANLSYDKDHETLLKAFASLEASRRGAETETNSEQGFEQESNGSGAVSGATVAQRQQPQDRVDEKCSVTSSFIHHQSDLRLLLIGDGPRRNDLEQLAAELGILDRVEFMGRRDDVPDLLRQMDVFVLSTKTEAFGLVLVEAMAAGVPLIASNVGGIPEIVTDGENGLLVDSGDPDCLASAITSVLDDTELRNRLVSAGKETAKRFSLESTYAAYRKLYEKSEKRQKKKQEPRMKPAQERDFLREHE